jgi:hypothetical protein
MPEAQAHWQPASNLQVSSEYHRLGPVWPSEMDAIFGQELWELRRETLSYTFLTRNEMPKTKL